MNASKNVKLENVIIAYNRFKIEKDDTIKVQILDKLDNWMKIKLADGNVEELLAIADLRGKKEVDVIRTNISATENNIEALQIVYTDEHPKVYDKVLVTYKFYGSDFKKDKIEKSVSLSVERYCGVFEMFRKFSDISHKIEYIEQ